MTFGYHIHMRKDEEGKNISEIIKNRIKIAEKIGIKMSNIQIYVVGPNDSKEILKESDKEYLRELSKKIDIYVHGSYLDHLLGKRKHFTIINIEKEMKICEEIKAKGLCVHIPKAEISEIAEVLCNEKILPKKTKLYLEIGSYKNNLYVNIDNIKELFDSIAENEPTKKYIKNYGFVLDTAHLWSSGINIETYEDAELYTREILTIKNIHNFMIQLNDQKWEFNSGSDEHSALTYGTIWEKYRKLKDVNKSGIAYYLDLGELPKNIPIILERKETIDIEKDLNLIHNLGRFSNNQI